MSYLSDLEKNKGSGSYLSGLAQKSKRSIKSDLGTVEGLSSYAESVGLGKKLRRLHNQNQNYLSYKDYPQDLVH